jgi:hypothetical protein
MVDLTARRDAFEDKFAHDEMLRFKAVARRNNLLGLWAAERLGKSGLEAEDYARSVVMADFAESGDEDVVRKILRDFEVIGLATTATEVRRMLEKLWLPAMEEIKSGERVATHSETMGQSPERKLRRDDEYDSSSGAKNSS